MDSHLALKDIVMDWKATLSALSVKLQLTKDDEKRVALTVPALAVLFE